VADLAEGLLARRVERDVVETATSEDRAGGLATTWTILGPILSIALIVLRISRSPAQSTSTACR